MIKVSIKTNQHEFETLINKHNSLVSELQRTVKEISDFEFKIEGLPMKEQHANITVNMNSTKEPAEIQPEINSALKEIVAYEVDKQQGKIFSGNLIEEHVGQFIGNGELCNGKQVIRKDIDDKFIRTVIRFAEEEGLTITNIKEAVEKACVYIADNATLKKTT